jgi:hypothetical protein
VERTFGTMFVNGVMTRSESIGSEASARSVTANHREINVAAVSCLEPPSLIREIPIYIVSPKVDYVD